MCYLALLIDDTTDTLVNWPLDPFNTKFILSLLYMLVDMALIAMFFNWMQEKVIKGVSSSGERLALYKHRKNGSSGTNVTSPATQMADS